MPVLLFRADERTSRRWARGERSVQGGVQILIELLLDRTISVRQSGNPSGLTQTGAASLFRADERT